MQTFRRQGILKKMHSKKFLVLKFIIFKLVDERSLMEQVREYFF